jgi:PAP2 superfamily
MADRGVLWIVVAGALWATGDRWARRAAWRGLGSLAAASATANLVGKGLSARRRPDVDVPAARRLPQPSSPSFPSGHAANAAAFAIGVAIEKPSLAAPAIALAAAVGASRIATGEHYPSDVLAGTAIGAAAGVMTLRWWPRRPDRPAMAIRPPRPAPAAPTGEGLVLLVNTSAGTASSKLASWLAAELPKATVIETRWPGPGGTAAPGRGGSTDTRSGPRRRHGMDLPGLAASTISSAFVWRAVSTMTRPASPAETRRSVCPAW